jgi:drug/metabolite transporter (DMT)-like permease
MRAGVVMCVLATVGRIKQGQPLVKIFLEPFKMYRWYVYLTSFFGMACELSIAMLTVEKLPIVIVAICTNMSPLFTTVFATCILNERLTFFNASLVTVKFLGVVMIMFG